MASVFFFYWLSSVAAGWISLFTELFEVFFFPAAFLDEKASPIPSPLDHRNPLAFTSQSKGIGTTFTLYPFSCNNIIARRDEIMNELFSFFLGKKGKTFWEFCSKTPNFKHGSLPPLSFCWFVFFFFFFLFFFLLFLFFFFFFFCSLFFFFSFFFWCFFFFLSRSKGMMPAVCPHLPAWGRSI